MNNNLFRKEIPAVKTIVVKTGSRILTSSGYEQRVKRLVEDLVFLKKRGLRTILVSSGAIAHGMAALGLTKRPATIPLQCRPVQVSGKISLCRCMKNTSPSMEWLSVRFY